MKLPLDATGFVAVARKILELQRDLTGTDEQAADALLKLATIYVSREPVEHESLLH